MSVEDAPRKALLSATFKIKAATFARCFAWPPSCPNPAIRAHSVQNARILDLIAKQGHVVAPTLRLDAKRGPLIDLDLVGRNEATTFAGLCADHDSEIFAAIENNELDVENPEHRFLLAYRAVHYEVHATAAAAWQVQTLYLKEKELGLGSKNQISPAGAFAVERMLVAYQTYMYKASLDEAFAARNFGFLEHDLINLQVQEPTLAASALFTLDQTNAADDAVRVCLSVLPMDKVRTVALFSYTHQDAALARKELSGVLESQGEEQKLELSRRLLNHCQNFAMSPSFVNSWTPAKRHAILELFVRTIFSNDLETQDPNVMLFR